MHNPSGVESTPAEAQARLAAIVESSDDAIVSKTLEGIVTSWNKGAERIFGWTSDEMKGRSITTIIPADRLSEEPQILARIRRGEPVDHFETVRQAKDGRLIDISVTVSPVRDANGRIIGASKIARDITEQKRLQRRLDQTASLVAAQNRVLEALAGQTTLTNVLQLVARAVEEQVGPDAIASILLVDETGKRLTNGASPGLPDEYLRAIDGIRIDPALGTCSAAAALGEVVITPDIAAAPSWKDFAHLPLGLGLKGCWTVPIFASDRRVLGTIGTYMRACRGPTEWERQVVEGMSRTAALAIERRQAEQALDASEARLRAVLQATPECVKVVSPEGGLTYMNASGLRMIEAADEDSVRGACVFDLIDPEHRPQWQQYHERVCQGERLQWEFEIVGLRGTRRWMETHAVPLPLPDGRFAQLAVTREVTEAKRIEREREELLESERATRAEAETLVRIGRTLSGELDLHRLVQAATEAATELSGAAFGAFFYNVPDDKGGHYTLYTIAGVPREEFSKFPMPRATDLFGPTFRGEGIVRLDDVTTDSRYGRNPPYNGMPAGHLPVRSYLAVPVKSRSGEVLGGLFLGHAEAARFTGRHERLVDGIAAHAAVAIDNARLYDAARTSIESAERSLGQLRAVVGSMAEGLILSDPDGNLLEWNPAALEMHGYRSNDEVRRHLEDVAKNFEIRRANGQPVPFAEWPLPRVLRGDTFANFEATVRRVDNDLTRVISYSGSPVRDRDGNVTLAVLTLHDVTEERRAQATIRESAERLRAIFEQSTAGIAQLDLDNRFVLVNQWFCDLLGYSREELLRLRVQDVTHPDDLPRNLAMLEQSKAGGRDYSIEKRYVRKDGTAVWVNVSSTILKGADGRPEGVLGVISDLTERKRAEAAIAESEQKFRQLAETIPQLAWMAKPDGWIFWYNRRWYEYTGTTPEQMEGWGWQDVHDPAELPRVVERWQHSISTGEPFEMEFPLKGADGQFRWFLTRVAPLRDGDGQITLWFGTNTDIEDRRRVAEERAQLLDAERMARVEAERSSRMKDEFLATLSHELRTPLNAILGWAQILSGEKQREEDLREGLTTIERNARVQTQIIEDLLDMSRIVSGKVRLDVQRLDLAGAVQAAVETVRPAADAKGIRVQTVLDPLAGPVSGDPNRLQQVFWNLLNNAVKFTPKGGRVQVLLERVNSHLEVSVIDTGEGIRPEFLPHVFDRFRQADASTTRKHGGLGLGLAIVKQLVELHGGSVRAKSIGPGHGSTFTVSLPLTVIHPEPEPDVVRRHPQAWTGPSVSPDVCVQLDGVRVLIVDDEPDARALLRRLLEDCHAVVTQAESAGEAFDRLVAAPPDVLVSDIGMPGEDGYSLIRRVRALPPGKGGNVPALALTAYARSEDRTRSVLAGFQMHMSKPVEPAELIAMVASLAGRTGGNS